MTFLLVRAIAPLNILPLVPPPSIHASLYGSRVQGVLAESDAQPVYIPPSAYALTSVPSLLLSP
jgi:hypothetical protein